MIISSQVYERQKLNTTFLRYSRCRRRTNSCRFWFMPYAPQRRSDNARALIFKFSRIDCSFKFFVTVRVVSSVFLCERSTWYELLQDPFCKMFCIVHFIALNICRRRHCKYPLYLFSTTSSSKERSCGPRRDCKMYRDSACSSNVVRNLYPYSS